VLLTGSAYLGLNIIRVAPQIGGSHIGLSRRLGADLNEPRLLNLKLQQRILNTTNLQYLESIGNTSIWRTM